MTARVIAAIVALCVGLSGCVLGNIFLTIMIGEINRKRPEENLISYFGFTPSKTLRIFREYRRLYPGGKFNVYCFASIGVMLIGFIVVAVSLDII